MWSRPMKKAILLIALILSARSVCVTGTKPKLQRVLGLSGENGTVAIGDGRISIYSEGSIYVEQPRDRQRVLMNNRSVISYVFRDGQWQSTDDHVPEVYAHIPTLCDPYNQINIGIALTKLAAALPTASKVKSFGYLKDKLALASYSDSDEKVTYNIRVALLSESDGGSFTALDTDSVTQYGTFCGSEVDPKRQLYFVFADEPAGSSDYTAVYCYTVQ